MVVGWPEIAVILVVVLILFGPKKIPSLARSIAKSVREFKKGMKQKKPKE